MQRNVPEVALAQPSSSSSSSDLLGGLSASATLGIGIGGGICFALLAMAAVFLVCKHTAKRTGRTTAAGSFVWGPNNPSKRGNMQPADAAVAEGKTTTAAITTTTAATTAAEIPTSTATKAVDVPNPLAAASTGKFSIHGVPSPPSERSLELQRNMEQRNVDGGGDGGGDGGSNGGSESAQEQEEESRHSRLVRLSASRKQSADI